MTPFEWILVIAVAIVIVAALTPQGKKGLSSLANTIGSAFGTGAKKLETPDSKMVELDARVTAETTLALQDAQNAHTRAQEILDQDKAQVAELTQWMANRDQAASMLTQLRGDAVNDELQQRDIGKALAIGETAMQKIAGIESSRKLNEPNVVWARDAKMRAEELFRALPQRAQDMLAQGNVAAAAQELAKSERDLANSQSAFSDSKASRLLAEMKQKASRAKAEATSAQARANAAPVSADVAAQQLSSIRTSTSSFEDFVNSKSQSAS
jgi:hypothetical protein